MQTSSVNPRRMMAAHPTTSVDCRLELNPEQVHPPQETPAEEILARVAPVRPPEVNNDHLHQLMTLLKDNMTSTLPFALILLIKAFYEHSAGILMVLFFSASIYHGNTILVEQTSLKSARRVWPVVRVLIVLSLSLGLFLYLFRQDEFYLSLIFLLPKYTKWDLWTLLWVLYATFCIVKMIIMLVKSLLILMPFNILKRKRGSYFSLIEHLSQFYISLLTIRPWICFIVDGNQQSGLFATMILIFYILVKSYNVYKSILTLRRLLPEVFKTLPFPPANSNELTEKMCPICQSEYRDPIVLTCKHIFCEECVSSWLDRNASCPLCRCQLPIGQANFRDGFTSGYLIWY